MERLICDWCGSANVTRDAWAAWNVAKQDWELSAVYDDGFCHSCECERSMSFVPVRCGADVHP